MIGPTPLLSYELMLPDGTSLWKQWRRTPVVGDFVEVSEQSGTVYQIVRRVWVDQAPTLGEVTPLLGVQRPRYYVLKAALPTRIPEVDSVPPSPNS